MMFTESKFQKVEAAEATHEKQTSYYTVSGL